MEKIRYKIIIPITSLIILLISFLVLFFNDLLKDTHLNIIKQEMNEKIDFIDLIIKENPGLYSGKINNSFSKKIKDLSAIINLRITVIDNSGNVIADSEYDPRLMDNHRYRIEIKDSINKKTGESIRYSNTLKVDMLYFAKSLDNYILRLAKPLHDIDATLKRFSKTIFILGILIIITAVIIIIIISNKITNPIRETRNFALALSKGDYSKRILNFSNDEIGVLQKTLNKMAEAIVDEMNLLIIEQNKLRVIFESISDGIAVIDNNKCIVVANKAFSSLLGIKTELAAGKIYYEVIRGSSLNKKIEQSIAQGQGVNFQEKFLTDRFCEIFIIPIKEETGIQGMLIVLRDITEKKKMDQLKTDLIGNLSHELKTPIAILKGYLETMQTNLDDTKMCADFVKKALVNTDRQDSIINDMLKLNMMETMNGIPVEKINLKEIIINCVDILQSKAKAKEIEISMDIDLPDRRVSGNKFLAEEIFFNIIINAINYTNPKGSINIKAQESSGKIIISIADSGIGIPEDSIDRIFERFYRVDKSRSRATGGTGLGLSIVKHAVEILNWGIDVESDRSGTRFLIEIAP